jgi:hypothetical protein
MPELSIVYAKWCETNECWQIEVKGRTGIYTVKYGSIGGTGYHDYTCTCPAYQYNKGKYCKHIEEVKDKRCAWNDGIIMGSFEEEPKDGKCPKCGADLLTVKVGV